MQVLDARFAPSAGEGRAPTLVGALQLVQDLPPAGLAQRPVPDGLANSRQHVALRGEVAAAARRPLVQEGFERRVRVVRKTADVARLQSPQGERRNVGVARRRDGACALAQRGHLGGVEIVRQRRSHEAQQRATLLEVLPDVVDQGPAVVALALKPAHRSVEQGGQGLTSRDCGRLVKVEPV